MQRLAICIITNRRLCPTLKSADLSRIRIKTVEFSYPVKCLKRSCAVLEFLMLAYFPHKMKTVLNTQSLSCLDVQKGITRDCVSFLEKCLRIEANERASAAQLATHPFVQIAWD